MACDPASPRYRWRWLGAALAAILIVGGCQKSAAVAHYVVPKEAEPGPPMVAGAADGTGAGDAAASDSNAGGGAAAESDAGSAAPTDRMLAAIVTHDESAWTFKLTGAITAVDKHAAEFESLVQSVKFSDQAGGQPQWKLPAGWTQAAGTSQMRLATITIPDEKPVLEITVGMIPWPAAENEQRLLMNMNRWRGQMQLKPTEAAGLAENMRSLKVAGGQATLVDLTGKFKAGSMAPFAGAAGGMSGAGGMPPGHPDMSGQMPAGHPAVSGQLPPGHPPMSSSATEPVAAGSAKEKSNSADHASAPELPFTFTVPKSWHAAALPTFAAAAFAITEKSPRPEVTITPLPEAAASIAANVGRWRSQLGLPAESDDELAAEAKAYKVDGEGGHWVQLQGPEGSDPRRAIVAAVVPHEGVNWIFALKADAAVADGELANFRQFVESVKFRPAGN